MSSTHIVRLKQAHLVFVALLVSACGGGGQNASPLSSQPVVVSATGSQAILNNAVVASFDSQFVSVSSQAGVALTDAIVSLNEKAIPISKELTVTIDVNAISVNENNAGITLFLQPNGIASAAVSIQGASGLTRVVRSTIGGVHYYSAATITGAQQIVNNSAVAAVSYSKEFVKAAGGVIKVVLLQIPISTTDNGQLYELTLVNSLFSTSPSIAASAVPNNTGKIPLVLVHGIQALCYEESTAYFDTWKKFAKYFHTDLSDAAVNLRSKYSLYSFAYKTDLGIAHNGERLNAELQRVFGTTKVVVLAHSMGGLVARYVDANTADGLAGLITLNTPHHGTKTVNDISPIISQLSKANYLLMLKQEMASKGDQEYAIKNEGFQTSCFMASQSTGAKDLSWDNFNHSEPLQRCSPTSNAFLCAAPNGININTKSFKQPTNVYIYSSHLWGDIQWTQIKEQILQIVSGSLMALQDIETIVNDGDVPLQSQQYQSFSGVYQWRTDIKTAQPYQNIDHVQIHDDIKVFTSGGIGGGGLSGDLNALVISLPSPVFTASLNGMQVNLDAGQSTPNMDIVQYDWDFGDGTRGNGINVQHTYAAYSSTPKVVTLRITDIYGRTATTAQNVSISLPFPSGLAVVAGNGQATLSWNVIAGASSYNLYMASATGLTKINYASLAGGSKISGVTSPLIQTGLTNGTQYHFVVTSVNTNGESIESSEVTATPQATTVVTPNVLSQAATFIQTTSAQLNGSINPNGLNTNVYFEYGTTTSYGINSPSSVLGGTTSSPVSWNLTGLTPFTIYHYRVVGSTVAGITAGNDVTFNTAALPLSCSTSSGICFYSPNGLLSYQFSSYVSSAANSISLSWGAGYVGPSGKFTGSLRTELWAVPSSYMGGPIIGGTLLGTISPGYLGTPSFTGAGAYSANQILANGYSTDVIASTINSVNPPPGQYYLVILLEQYMPNVCIPAPTPNANGFCIVDWKQFPQPVNFN